MDDKAYYSPSEVWYDSQDSIEQTFLEHHIKIVKIAYIITPKWRIFQRRKQRQALKEMEAKRERMVQHAAQKLQDALKPRHTMLASGADPFLVIRTRTDDPEILAALDQIEMEVK